MESEEEDGSREIHNTRKFEEKKMDLLSREIMKRVTEIIKDKVQQNDVLDLKKKKKPCS